ATAPKLRRWPAPGGSCRRSRPPRQSIRSASLSSRGLLRRSPAPRASGPGAGARYSGGNKWVRCGTILQEAKVTDAATARLWVPSPARIGSAGITRYRRWLEQERGLRFDGYDALWRWSVQELEAFWASIWDFCGVISHRPYERVLERRVMPGARWFEGATVNYAEQSLWRALRPEWMPRAALVFE